MEDIEFRVFYDGKMWTVEYINFERSLVGLLRGQQETLEIVEVDWSDCYLMQYVTIRDKNNIKIYESDIVKEYWTYRDVKTKEEKNETTIWKIRWSTDSLRWCLSGLGSEAVLTYMRKVEVIGNIYENPELLQ